MFNVGVGAIKLAENSEVCDKWDNSFGMFLRSIIQMFLILSIACKH